MNPKEKAKELIEKFLNKLSHIEYDEGDSSGYTAISFDDGKQCAKIAVEEIKLLITNQAKIHRGEFSFWNEVLKEIETI